MAVARLAGAGEFIDKLPQGYDTMIEERGANLSGGRRTPLSPGMTVTVEIATGNRRILEYLFSPLVETTADAMKER